MNEKCKNILKEFKKNYENYELVRDIAVKKIEECIKEKDIPVCIFESRVKEEHSLEGKLERKGDKYDSIWDITDLIGARVVTYYTHDVDRIAMAIGLLFDIDRENSDDKRSIQTGDSFGYLSLHLICSIPESLYSDPARPEINRIRFEIQIRTLLQHMWAATQHNTGYKTDVDIPVEYRRRYSRLAGLLEIADEEYSSLLTDLERYRKSVRKLVETANYDDLSLNRDTFNVYMNIDSNKEFPEKLAVSFNTEVVNEPYDYFYDVFRAMGVKTIMDAEAIRKDCEEEAYRLAMVLLSEGFYDNVSSNILAETTCLIYILKKYGRAGLKEYYKCKNGTEEGAEDLAQKCIEIAKLAKINI